MLIVRLFISYVHVSLCHFFSSSWCRGLAAVSACGTSWTFLFTFMRTYMQSLVRQLVDSVLVVDCPDTTTIMKMIADVCVGGGRGGGVHSRHFLGRQNWVKVFFFQSRRSYPFHSIRVSKSANKLCLKGSPGSSI